MHALQTVMVTVLMAASGVFAAGTAVAAPASTGLATPAPAITAPSISLPSATALVPDLTGVSTSVTPTAVTPTAATVAGTPCTAPRVRACVDLSARRAWLITGGKVSFGPTAMTSGKKGFRTPTGTFRVSFKNKNHVSSIYQVPMPNAVFFNRGIAFHQGSLNVQSHGCIHLSRAASQRFFAALRPGDVVQVVA